MDGSLEFFAPIYAILVFGGFVSWPVLVMLISAARRGQGSSFAGDVCFGMFAGAMICYVPAVLIALLLSHSSRDFLPAFVVLLSPSMILGGPPGALVVRIIADRRRRAEIAAGRLAPARNQDAESQPLQFHLSSLLRLTTAFAVICAAAACVPAAASIIYWLSYQFGPCVAVLLAAVWPGVAQRHRKIVAISVGVLLLMPMLVIATFPEGVRALGAGRLDISELAWGTAVSWGFQIVILAMLCYALRPMPPAERRRSFFDLHCACGQLFKAMEADAGLRVPCPRCGAVVTIPPLSELRRQAM